MPPPRKSQIPSTLYLTRNGLLEPLGQSQIISYLRGISTEYNIILITYEKASDWADSEFMYKMKMECDQLGIRWLPQRFYSKPKIISPAFCLLHMIWLVAQEVRIHQVSLIHARSYLPAAAALVVREFLKTPFIFDMRALWPEELITAGRIRRESWLHRAMVAIERATLRRADGVVSLTHAAIEHLKKVYSEELEGKLIVTIPTCADLDRFSPSKDKPEKRVIGCLGTVLSGWFRLDWLASFFAVAAKRDPELRFEVTTRDDPARVRAIFESFTHVQSRLQVRSSPSSRVHEIIQLQTASVMFFTDGLGKLGSSPTRMAEILGCGLPVVANEGVGDVPMIIKKYRVGVLVSGPSEWEMNEAWDDLQSLLNDPELPLRCRRAAEEVFSLKTGTNAYLSLYHHILSSKNNKGVFSA